MLYYCLKVCSYYKVLPLQYKVAPYYCPVIYAEGELNTVI